MIQADSARPPVFSFNRFEPADPFDSQSQVLGRLRPKRDYYPRLTIRYHKVESKKVREVRLVLVLSNCVIYSTTQYKAPAAYAALDHARQERPSRLQFALIAICSQRIRLSGKAGRSPSFLRKQCQKVLLCKSAVRVQHNRQQNLILCYE